MDPITQQVVLAAAGTSAAADATNADDVFSTYVYEGTGSAQTITNGIDLAGEGGLVWIKNRSSGNPHHLYDTVRGATKYLSSNSTNQENTYSTGLTAFGANSFTLGAGSDVNASSSDYVSWTFRKAPKFFDVVTYSGTGSTQNISHSLGSVPGMILIHCRDGSHDWEVYHQSTGATKSLHLNKIDAQVTDSTVWNNTTPTSSVFTVGTSSNVNQNGHDYVAYIFATLPGISKVGSYSGSTGSNIDVDCGFTAGARFVLIKRTDSTGDWYVWDTVRGIVSGNDPYILLNTAAAQITNYDYIDPSSSGFTITSSAPAALNVNGGTYLFLAIA